jgi:hypothetical protein
LLGLFFFLLGLFLLGFSLGVSEGPFSSIFIEGIFNDYPPGGPAAGLPPAALRGPCRGPPQAESNPIHRLWLRKGLYSASLYNLKTPIVRGPRARFQI